MNNLTPIISPLTMTSSAIADLVESRHDNVKRTVERLAARGVIQLPPTEEVKNHLGQTVSEYHIGKRDSYVIVAQLSPEFTGRLVDRWQELESQVAELPHAIVAALTKGMEAKIGGIVKAVTNKAIDVALDEKLPALVRGALAGQEMVLRRGQTAGQVWRSHGLPAVKNGPQMLSRRLVLLGCLIDGGGKGELGGKTAKLFDPDKANAAMKYGGLLEVCKAYADKRLGMGQASLMDILHGRGSKKKDAVS